MKPLNYDELDPGIREVVRRLREEFGFNTTDSGDGSKAATMECAVPFPMVACVVSKYSLWYETDRLLFALRHIDPDRQWSVEGVYSALDGAAVLIATCGRDLV